VINYGINGTGDKRIDAEFCRAKFSVSAQNPLPMPIIAVDCCLKERGADNE
jgi:hypothetical protein